MLWNCFIDLKHPFRCCVFSFLRVSADFLSFMPNKAIISLFHKISKFLTFFRQKWFPTQSGVNINFYRLKSTLVLTHNVVCGRKSQLYVSHMCKRIFRFKLWLSSYWQNIKFSRNCPKFHIFTKIVIFKV